MEDIRSQIIANYEFSKRKEIKNKKKVFERKNRRKESSYKLPLKTRTHAFFPQPNNDTYERLHAMHLKREKKCLLLILYRQIIQFENGSAFAMRFTDNER